MVADSFHRTLRAITRRAPFRPFTVELVSGERIEVDHPEALVYRAGVAVHIGRDGSLSVFDHEGVNRIIGNKPTDETNGKGRRRGRHE